MFRLRVVPKEGPPFEHHVRGGVVRIGRAPDCELTLNDAFLSRYHAQFTLSDGDLEIEDLGSSNGTYVNGDRIAQRTRIAVGDLIRLSGSQIEVAEEVEEKKAAPLPKITLDEAKGGMTLLRPIDELMAEMDAESEAAAPADGLRHYADRLKLLNELHKTLSRPIDLEELLGTVLDGAFEHLGPEQAVIFMREEDGSVQAAASRSRGGDSEAPVLSTTLVEEVMEKGQAAIAIDTQSDERFAAAKSILAAGARSLVAAPLQDSEKSLGMIVLYSNLQTRTFDEEDLELLASIASVSAMRIRNLALVEQAAEQERLESELTMARRIQESLLPTSFPEIEGLSSFGQNAASRWVSGDYFNILERGDDELIVALADVCGKGMPAALLTATLEAIWAALIQSGMAPEEICAHANSFLYQRTPPDRFATAFFASIDRQSGTMRYVNAGHNPPLMLRAGGALEELPATGFPFGMVPEAEYEHAEIDLAAGDMLIAFTDGIVEAMNPEGEQYQLDRLADACLRLRDKPLAEMASEMDRELVSFVDGVPFVDDRTLVLVRKS